MNELEAALSLIDAPSSAENLRLFSDLFTKWNHRINLSAARSPGEVLEHVLDSLQVVPHLRGKSRVLDVGSGGGFPVIVGAICVPDTEFVALEPVHKKHAFLRTVVRELGLSNLSSRAERLEDHSEHDYDVASSRATFDLKDWIAMGLDRVRVGGIVIGFEAILRTDLLEVARHPYELHGKRRSLVIARR